MITINQTAFETWFYINSEKITFWFPNQSHMVFARCGKSRTCCGWNGSSHHQQQYKNQLLNTLTWITSSSWAYSSIFPWFIRQFLPKYMMFRFFYIDSWQAKYFCFSCAWNKLSFKKSDLLKTLRVWNVMTIHRCSDPPAVNKLRPLLHLTGIWSY